MKRQFKAVTNCYTKQPNKVNDLATKVISGLTTNAATFPGTAPAVTTLTTENNKLTPLIANAPGNRLIKDQRDAQTVKVYNLLTPLVATVTQIAAGKLEIIDLSGFPASAEPTPQPIPDQVVIQRITDGKTQQSAKVYINPVGLRNLIYTIQVTKTSPTSAMDSTWTVALTTKNSRNIVLENLERGKEIFIQINATNARGTGLWSEPISFIPR